MGMGFAPTWLRQVSPLPLLHKKHFNHWSSALDLVATSARLNPAKQRLVTDTKCVG